MSALGFARRWMAAAAAFALVGLMAACSSEETAVANLCIAGQEIFCRCEDGSPGTQSCNGDGKSLGECGPCDGSSDVDDDGASLPPPVGDDPPPGSDEGRALFAVCSSPGDCESAMCDLGYCTRPCDKPSDCGFPEGECVPVGTQGRCLAACEIDETCSTYGLACDEAVAIDGWHVRVCR